MEYLTVLLISLVVGAQCRSLVPTSSEEENDKQRLVRVHRVASEERSTTPTEIMNFELNILDSASTASWDTEGDDARITESFVGFETEQLEKMLSTFMKWVGQSTEHEEKLAHWLKQLMVIAKELSAKVNGVTNSVEYGKPVGRSHGTVLKDLLAFVDTLDIQNQKQTAEKSGDDVSSDDSSLRNVPNGTAHLNEMLADAQTQMGQIRKFFEQLCRKHHATKQ